MVFLHYVFSYGLLRCLTEKMFDYKCRSEMVFLQNVFCNELLDLLLVKKICCNQNICMAFHQSEYACVSSTYWDEHTYY